MSIQSEINRITSSRDSALTEVASKGVTVPSDSTIDDLPGLIRQIQTGSGGGGSIKCERGSVTLESDWTWSSRHPYYAIPHGLGEAPELVILWPTLTDSTGPNRGYIYMAKPMGEARQRLSSSAFNTTSTQANYTVYSFDDPLTVSIGVPGSQSYVNKLPDATNIYLSKFASSTTWKAGTYNYFIASGWIQEE